MGNQVACCSRPNGEVYPDEGQNIPKTKKKDFKDQYNDFSNIQRSGKLALEKERSIENNKEEEDQEYFYNNDDTNK
jgi:hypothetical protein